MDDYFISYLFYIYLSVSYHFHTPCTWHAYLCLLIGFVSHGWLPFPTHIVFDMVTHAFNDLIPSLSHFFFMHISFGYLKEGALEL